MRDWTRTGLFFGSQIFLDKLVYMVIIVKMVNEVSSVGIYWLANNFIWGWLLIPIVALAEMTKRDYYNGYRRIYNYLMLVAVIAFAWLLSVPLWDVMFTDVVQAQGPRVSWTTVSAGPVLRRIRRGGGVRRHIDLGGENVVPVGDIPSREHRVLRTGVLYVSWRMVHRLDTVHHIDVRVRDGRAHVSQYSVLSALQAWFVEE